MFLTPFFLYLAAAGAAIPLVLHLMQSTRKVQLPFPTVRFLKLAEKHSSRKARLENLLLWLLRTLIMALLGLAFAMPIIRSAGLGFLGEAPRDVAIVLDASYSMNYRTGRGTVWDRGLDAARTVIEGLTDKDRFCIFLAREQPEALIAEPIANKEEGVSRLKALQPGTASSRLAPAVSAALKALRKAETRREREIHIITDNQALAWQSFAEQKEEIEKQIGVFIALLGVPNPENVAAVSVEVQPPVVRKGGDIKITAALSRSGKPADTTATLFIDDKDAGRRQVKAGDPDSAAPTFNLPPLDAGMHVARIQTPEDNLPIDDALHFLIRVQDQMPSLLVGSADDTLFVRTALRTGFGGASAVTAIAPDQLAEQQLSNFTCVILCNALPISGQAMAAIEDYVKGGGLLVIFPGMKATPDAYKSWTCLPGFPTAVEDVPLAQQNRTLTWDKPQHPLVRPLREGIAVPTLAIRRRLAWKELHETTDRLVSMGADQPFLLDRQFGDGRVLMFAVAADRTWSDFPLSPFYLPLIVQCADYSGSVGAKAPFVWATDALSLSERFPDLKGTPTMSAPDATPVLIRSANVQGRAVLIAENLNAPGIYTLNDKPALAVNLARNESDLTPIPEAEIAKRLGVETAHVATDVDALKRMIEEHRVGRTYGEHLLWLAFALIVVEFLVANVLMRATARAVNVSVDAAGHVTKSAPELAAV